MTIDFGAVAARGHLGADVFGPGHRLWWLRPRRGARWPPSLPRRHRATTRWSPSWPASNGWGRPRRSMAAAVQPYVAWMTTTAGQAEQAAAQAQSAAAAFEAAFAGVVPPPLIAANRAELTQAIQTNVLGLNNGIIAQLEAQYAEMWAQDAATMYSYAASSRRPQRSRRLSTLPTIANPAASSLQSAATAAASGNPASSIQSTFQGLTSMTTTAAELSTPGWDEKLYASSANNPLHRDLVPADRADHLAHQPWGPGERLWPLRELLLQHRGSALLQRWYGQLRCADRQVGGWLGGAAPAAAAACPKAHAPLGAGGGAGGQVAAGLGNGAHVAAPCGPARVPGSARRRRRSAGPRRRSASPWPQARPGPETWWVACPRASGRSGVASRRRPPIRVQTHRHGPPTPRRVTRHLTHPQGAPAAHLRPARLSASVSKLVRRERASRQLLSGRMSVSAVLAGRPSPRRTLRVGFYCGRIFIRRGGFHPAECPAGGPLIGHREPSAGGASVRSPR